jgi:Protein of unknown function with PCYCGC motif
MGRKSSAKAGGRETSQPSRDGGQPPSRSSGRSSTTLVVAAIIAVVAVGGGYAYVSNGRAASAATDHSAHDQAQSTPAPSDAVWAKFGPHKQANYPPLPTQAYAPPRPMNVVRDAYMFAAEHPEVLSYVPCFCGCERGGHKGNHDCFVANRDQKGDVTQWEPHGLECTVCIDVATEARQLYASGANVREIRAAVEKKWAGFNGGHTPTPAAPAKGE